MREIQAMLAGQEFGSVEEIDTRLAELTREGRLHEIANAWNQNDPKWRAQELAYDALESDDPIEALRMVNQALKLDPDCTQAQQAMVSLMPMDLDSRVRLMREVVEKAERNMGESFIRETTGHFWMTMSTRPYMRAKRGLAEVLARAGQLQEAIAIFERMLELDPEDHLGARFALLGLYLATHQPQRADSLIARYPDEENILGIVAWARVLERWLSERPDHAEALAALAKARKVNPFVERYLSGATAMPEESPPFYRPGEESEARMCAQELATACERNLEFRKWLRASYRKEPWTSGSST
jgi:tetratricopeptide (TPR) repeat protein